MQITLAFLFGAPGGPEILLILFAVLVMFGPKKLPEIARNIGKAMETLRKTSQEFRDQVMRIDQELPKIDVDLPKLDIDLDTSSAEHSTQTGQIELPLGTNETSSTPEDPYRLYEDQNNSNASVTSEPENNQATVKEPGNAAETNPSTTGSQPCVPQLEDQEVGRKDGLAG